MPAYEFIVDIRGSEGEIVSGSGRIQSIEVRNGAKLVQSIQYANDDDAPLDFGDPSQLVSLVDVDCDGYKDLFVRKSIGEGANAWFYLYRFQPESGKFVAYPKFEQVSLTV